MVTVEIVQFRDFRFYPGPFKKLTWKTAVKGSVNQRLTFNWEAGGIILKTEVYENEQKTKKIDKSNS